MIKTFPALRRFHYYHLHSGAVVPLNCFSISGQRLRSGHPQLPYHVKGLQECINPLVVTQYSVYYPSTSGDDLDRYSHQTVKKPPKLHGEKFIPVFPSSHQQGKPSFQAPRQRRHDHIGPVGLQSAYGHPQGLQAVFELFDQIFRLHRSLQNLTTSAGAISGMLVI